eukprot:14575256-Alexandrium_andersonii.AAC.1
MSASLVGSEMCIRDSLLAATLSCWQRTTEPWRAGTRRQWDIGTPESDKGCLLYTSDAADDM